MSVRVATAASLNAGGVCREPMGQLPGAAQGDVVAAVHLVRVDAQTLTCVPARPCRREHAIVTAEEVPRGRAGPLLEWPGSCSAFAPVGSEPSP